MRDIEDNISNLVENHFPQFYREEGNTFVEFVKEYYKWAESSNNYVYYSRNLLEFRDVDKSIDLFLNYLKDKYLIGTKLDPIHTRFDLKHVQDIYTAKGTERGTRLFLNRVYGLDEVDVYFPGNDILKASDGNFYRPLYLELSISDKTNSFLGKVILGSVSGATAFVDNISRKNVNGHTFDVVFISDLQGNFINGENVSADGIVKGSPKIIGSITNLTLEDAGKQFVLGDVVELVSERTGVNGRAIVTEVTPEIGSASFRIIKNGFGYSSTGDLDIAEKTLEIIDRPSSNAYHTDFYYEELVTQPLVEVLYNTANVVVKRSDHVTAANSTNGVVGTGVVVGVTQDNVANGTMLIASKTGSLATATYFYISKFFNASSIDATDSIIYLSNSSFTNNSLVRYSTVTGNTVVSPLSNNSTYYVTETGNNTSRLSTSVGGASINLVPGANEIGHLITPYTGSAFSGASIVSFTDKTATGYIAKSNTTHIGLVNVTNSFTGNNYNDISGSVSGIRTTVTEVSVGTGANASIGGVRVISGVYLNTDYLASNTSNIAVAINANSSITNATDFISVPNNKITNNFILNYRVSAGSTALTNLANNGNYYVVSANSTGFKLSNTLGGSTINLTKGLTQNGHTFTGNTTFMNLYINSLDYKFAKLSNSNINVTSNSLLNEALSWQTYSLGSVTTLKNVNPGQGYNIAPLVRVIDYKTEGSNKFNMHIVLSNKVGNFSNGEIVDQDNIRRSYLANVIGSNTGFQNFETVTQNTGTVNVYGVLVSSNNTYQQMKMYEFISGTVNSNTTSNNVSGLATYFSSELKSGDNIQFSGCTATYTVGSVISNTTLQLTTNAIAASSLQIQKVSPFVNSTISSAFTGSVSSNVTSSRVNGSSTAFLTDIAAGDFIKFSGNTFILQVNNVVSDTEMYLTTNSVSTVANSLFKATKVIFGVQSRRGVFANAVAFANITSKASGTIVDVNTTLQTISIDRRTFDEDFTFGPTAPVVVGRTSGAYANPLWITKTQDVMGNNALITTSSANGSILSLDLLSSGYAYQDGELLTLVSGNNEFTATAYANLINQGISEGYFTSTRGFLNSDKYLHDNDFYQNFSYQIRSGLSLEIYLDTLKRLMHIAGNKVFGTVVKSSVVNGALSAGNSQITVTPP